jgi:ATP-dependent DNA helicase RecG
MEEIIGRFRARNAEEEIMFGLLRIGIPDYPGRAFREGLANALIHRDYTRLGATHIQWHDDRIEISNPGGFPEGVHLNNILVTTPRPRNPLLADAFKRAGIVERTGRGIDTIFYEQLRNGRPAPSYSRSSETSVVLIFPGGKANQSFVRLVAEEDQSGRILSLDELYILNRLWIDRRLPVSEIALSIQKPESEARSILEGLIERGIIEARGERKARTYHLSVATSRRLGAESSYIRQQGFEPLQQEEMILQYLEKYGRISRSQAAEMCQISVFKAGRLLKRIRNSGKIRLAGAGKAAHYELIR